MRRIRLFSAVFGLAAIAYAAGAPAFAENCTQPDWKHKPTREELVGVWPREAVKRGINGTATIDCSVSTQGALHDCKVLRESPPGQGFGQAALALTPQFTVSPKACDGRPMAGASVQIPIRFSWLNATLATGSRLPRGLGSVRDGPLVLDRPAWINAPTYAQVVAAYPEAARRDKTAGHVALQCEFADAGRLHDCDVVSEVPEGHGYGAAARELSRDFVGPETDSQGQKTRNDITTLAFSFDPQMLNGQTPVIGMPQWTHLPESLDLTAGFPAAAVAAHVMVGHVALGCDVGLGGHLGNCVVSRQSPEGLGFDRAALALSASFQVTVWTDEGLPTVGGHIVVPIRYEPPAATPTP